MTLWALYMLLLKATATSFTGLASLPVVRQELVVKHKTVTDVELDTAVALSRVTPGPVGLYVVAVGYYEAGWPGALVGWAALATPAFIAVPLLMAIGRIGSSGRMAAAVKAVVVASAGLLLGTMVPMASSALTDALTVTIAIASAVVLIRKDAPVFLVIVLAGLATSLSSLVH